MKCRVIESPLYVDLINSWGAKAVAMNFDEVYTALQQKVIDSTPNSPYSYSTVRHYEVAPYFSITDHMHACYSLTISKKVFDALASEIQEAIKACARELIPISTKITAETELRVIGELVRKHKVLFNVADKDTFKAASKEVIEKWSKNVGMEIIERIRAAK